MTGLDELKITVEEIIRKHETELQLASSVPWYDVYQAIKFVMRENPDLFWFSHQWSMTQMVLFAFITQWMMNAAKK